MPNRETEYRQALAQADACVEEAAGACAADPRRPIFHVMPKGRFMNDPNGPVYFNGEYHVFYQHLPFFGDERHDGRPYWGHAVSPDLVHWEQLPIALAPGPEPYDSGACASGGCVVRDGVPTIVYTGFAGKQVQCLAMSDDNGRTWRKYEGNPVVAAPPDIENLADGFRDPVVWQEDDEWRMLVGSAIQGEGGTALLYRSPDLVNWEFMNPLCVDLGPDCIQWECPAFFPLGGRHVLVISPLYASIPSLRGEVVYAVGDYDGSTFRPDGWASMDLGGPGSYYAPSSFPAPDGRRIVWGWIMTGGSEGVPWQHCLTLPRVPELGSDGRVRFSPAEEIKALRGKQRSFDPVALQPGGLFQIADLGAAEVRLALDLRDAAMAGVRLLDANGSEMAMVWNSATRTLHMGDRKVCEPLATPECEMRLFLDGSVLEVYTDGAAFSTNAPFPLRNVTLEVYCQEGTAQVNAAESWEMGTIW